LRGNGFSYRHESLRIDSNGYDVMPLNSPGGSTQQWGRAKFDIAPFVLSNEKEVAF